MLNDTSRDRVWGGTVTRICTTSGVCAQRKFFPLPNSGYLRARGTAGRISRGLTFPKVVLWTLAVGLSARATSSVVFSSSSVAKSTLLTRITSAFSACSASSWPTVSKVECSTPSSFRSDALRLSSQSVPNELASTTVIVRLISVCMAAGTPTSTPMSQCLRIASGSPTPLSSITMWWKGLLPPLFNRSWTVATKSSVAVQHTQPFDSSAISMAPPRSYLWTSWASMFTAATSLTMTPRRTPSWFSSTCFSRVVLPAPKNPVSIVIGVLERCRSCRRRSSAPVKSITMVPGPSSSSSFTRCE